MAPHKTIFQLFIIVCFFLFCSSCNNDKDLFYDYVDEQIEDEINSQESGEIGDGASIAFKVADDEITISGNVSASTLDVLKNDSIPLNEIESFKILSFTEPAEGELTLNENNTFRYAPNPGTADKVGSNDVVVDTFKYTLEVTSDGIKEQKEANVIVNTEYGNESGLDFGSLKAFPSALGYGQNTTGGRGGQIIHVTNLNNSGPGSLREAVETSGRRTIVFDVAGDIDISSVLVIGSGSSQSKNRTLENLSILGETAPSPGITIRGEGINVYSSNVIISHITVRPDNYTKDVDGIRIRNVHNGYTLNNIMLYRITSSHAEDECISIQALNSTSRIENVTIQECMMYNSHPASPYSILVGPHTTDISLIRNYMGHNADRSPFIGYGVSGETSEVINNVIYNFKEGSHIAFGNTTDYLGNIIKDNPTNPAGGDWIKYYKNTYNNPGADENDGDIYHADNIFINGPAQVDESWNTANESSRRLTNSLVTTWLTSQSEIEAAVLDKCGNSLYRENLDASIVSDYYMGTGNRSSVPPIVPKPSTAHPDTYDTDNDGMADEWEIRTYGTLSNTASSDENDNGYTNLEEFLFSLTQ